MLKWSPRCNGYTHDTFASDEISPLREISLNRVSMAGVTYLSCSWTLWPQFRDLTWFWTASAMTALSNTHRRHYEQTWPANYWANRHTVEKTLHVFDVRVMKNTVWQAIQKIREPLMQFFTSRTALVLALQLLCCFSLDFLNGFITDLIDNCTFKPLKYRNSINPVVIKDFIFQLNLFLCPTTIPSLDGAV